MRVNPPDNPLEDRLIALLDRGIALDWREIELTVIRRQMRQREKARLKALRAAAMAKQ